MTQPTPFPVTLHDGTVCRSAADYARWFATKRQAHDSGGARRVFAHDGEHSGYTIGDVLREQAAHGTAASAPADAQTAADAGPIEVVDDITQRPDVLLGSLVDRQPLKRADGTEPTIGTDSKAIETVDLARRTDISLGFQKEQL
jgi:hypothetical protein